MVYESLNEFLYTKIEPNKEMQVIAMVSTRNWFPQYVLSDGFSPNG